jgi:hypothetical protein
MLKSYDNYNEDGRIDTDKGRLCCGETRPQDWENYPAPWNGWGLKATVDISKCNFRDPPYLMTSLACNDVSCGVINGGGAFNTLTTTSFKAYVRIHLRVKHPTAISVCRWARVHSSHPSMKSACVAARLPRAAKRGRVAEF